MVEGVQEQNIFSYLDHGKSVPFGELEKLYPVTRYDVKVSQYFVIFRERYRKSRDFLEFENLLLNYLAVHLFESSFS